MIRSARFSFLHLLSSSIDLFNLDLSWTFTFSAIEVTFSKELMGELNAQTKRTSSNYWGQISCC